MKKLFFSAGEPSGDVHGANLIQALRELDPTVQCVGFGGPRMKEAGLDPLFDLTTLAVMWLSEVLKQLRKFFELADQAEEMFRTAPPDAVILIDYPGFNWHIAKRAKRYGIPVFYYSPPQIWAWKQGRVKKMRRLIDHVFSGLPFETDWLAKQGVSVEYVGHPFFDEVRNYPRSSETLERLRGLKPLVGLLPGSRTGEVQRNFPIFWNAVRKIQRERPDVHFAVAAFRDEHAAWIRDFLENQDEKSGNIEVLTRQTPEIIQAADCCLSVSGSVSLELLHHEVPTVISYRVGRVGWWLQYWFRRVRFITLVNLLTLENPFRRPNPEFRPGSEDARDAIFPEYLTFRDRSDWIAADLLRWLQDPSARDECAARLAALREQIGQPGAARKTAEKILAALGTPKSNARENPPLRERPKPL